MGGDIMRKFLVANVVLGALARRHPWLTAGDGCGLLDRAGHGRWEKPDRLHRSVETAATALYRA